MLPHFRSREFLVAQMADALAYLYAHRPDGGLTEHARVTGDLALAYLAFGDPAYRHAAAQGVACIATAWRDGVAAGDAGAALLSACAHAAMAGVAQARPLLSAAADALARHATGAPAALALVDAYGASDELAYLRRAEELAHTAVAAGVQDDRLRWTRVLFALERHRRELAQRAEWLLPAACALFEQANAAGVPDQDGDDLAAAALLGARTGRIAYWVRYDQLCAAHQDAAPAARARLFSAYAQALDVIDSAP